MARVPALAITLTLASAGVLGFAYMTTRPVATMTMTEELSNFGTDVQVAVPPAASVVDVADLAGSPSLQ
jgi:hypothetical protein